MMNSHNFKFLKTFICYLLSNFIFKFSQYFLFNISQTTNSKLNKNNPNSTNSYKTMTGRILSFVFAISCLKCVTNACTDDFVPLNEGCYYFSTENAISWVDALTNCANRNSQLVSIETVEESFAINLHLYHKHGHNKAAYWTSGSDVYQQGHYIWMTKGKSFTYVSWCHNEPDNDGNEDCIHLIHQSNGSTCWNDAKCLATHVYDSIPMRFICERGQ